MTTRFRKRLKIAPGFYINLNWSKKRGISTSASVGEPGANFNVGSTKDGIGIRHGTIGIPGSGVSKRIKANTTQSASEDDTEDSTTSSTRTLDWFIVIVLLSVLGAIHTFL